MKNNANIALWKSILILFCVIPCFELSAQFKYSRRAPKPFLKGSVAKIYAPTDNRILVQSESNTTGYFYTDKEYMESLDGGQSWKLDTMQIPSFIKGIGAWNEWDFISDQIVFSEGRTEVPGYYPSHILKSTDGGKNWTGNPTPAIFNMRKFDFFDAQNGFSASDFFFYKTTDGGQTWIEFSSYQPERMSGGTQMIATGTNSFVFVNSWGRIFYYSGILGNVPSAFSLFQPIASTNFGFNNLVKTPSGKMIAFGAKNDFSGYYRVESTDNGSSWNITHIDSSGNFNYHFDFVKFADENVGYGKLSNSARVFKTTDAGFSWNPINGGDVWNHFDVSPNGTIWGTSFENQLAGILKSTNQGVSFTNPHTPMSWYVGSISHPNDSTFWVRADSVYKSTSKGLNWKSVSVDDNNKGESIEFITKDVGYAISQNTNYIRKTTNGGQSWNSLSWGPTLTIRGKFKFINKDTGWVSLDNSQFARTLNGGQTWTLLPVNSTPDGYLDDFDASSFDNLWIIFTSPFSPNSIVRKSTDGGATWIEIWNNASAYKIFVLDKMNVWLQAGNNQNGLYRTKDGGVNWVFYPIESTDYFVVNLHFVTSNLGYYLSIRGHLFGTKNGGQSWKQLSPEYMGQNFCFSNGVPIAIGGPYGRFYTLDSWSPMGNYLLSGRVAENGNGNCVAEASEAGIANNILTVMPDQVYGMSASDGSWSIGEVDFPGPKTILQIPGYFSYGNQTQICPPNNAPLSASLTTSQNTRGGLDFISVVPNCPALNVGIAHSTMRPCRKSYAVAIIRNTGKATSQAQEIRIKFPEQLYLLKSQPSLSWNPTDSTFRAIVPPLGFNQTYIFNIEDSVKCDPNGLTGRLLCVKATLNQGNLCIIPSVDWDGADLEVASRCQNGQTKFTLHNKGAAMSSTSQYQIYIDSALVYQAPFQLAANGSMMVTLPPNAPSGFTRLVVPQSANHPAATFASAEANCTLGLSSNGIFAQSDQSPLVDIECISVTNSYDPNDKTVYPKGWGTAGNVEPETEFTYKIRFQNTGTDTAFKVVLVDTLDEDLDIASLQIGAASHPFTFKVSGKGRPVFTWTFDNILLPDSNTNQLASNGFVSYSVHPKAGLALGTRLENFADIYFDFNDPIRTNTTVNTLWQPTYTPGILDTVFVTGNKLPTAFKAMKINPNPAVDFIKVQLPDRNFAILEITDLQGKEIKRLKVVSDEDISIKDLKPGIYILKMDGYRVERLVVKP